MSDPIDSEFDHAAFTSKAGRIFIADIMVAGLGLGLKLLGKINDERFWKTVLWLLLLAGLAVVMAALALVFGPFELDSYPSAPPM
jgi:hypothetical protein